MKTAAATRDFLLDPRAGWQVAELDRVDFDGQGFLRLRPVPTGARPLVDAAGSFGGLELPTGVAVDAYDHIYLLDAAAAAIKRFDPCRERFDTLSCIGGHGGGPRRLHEPRGLAISRCGDLYVADTGNRRVQVFALKGLSLRAVWGPFRVVPDSSDRPERAPADPPFAEGVWEPWDVAVGVRGRVYVADRANDVVHRFGPRGWENATTGEAPGEHALESPTHLAVDAAGRVYVAQEGRSEVVVLAPDGSFVERVSTTGEVAGRFDPSGIAVDDYGNLLLVDGLAGAVHRCCRMLGRHVYAGRVRACARAAGPVTFDPSGRPVVVDSTERRVLRVAVDGAYEAVGSYLSKPLDSEIDRCPWHRVVVRATLPEGARILVQTLTSETPLPSSEVSGLPEERWHSAPAYVDPALAKWDCLVFSPPGRYLWLRLELRGGGTSTPVVREVEVELPRSTSLRFLPAVYREDPIGSDFLDRFLAILDGVRDDLGGGLDDLARYFAAATAPADGNGMDFLAWLASWLGLGLDARWSVEKRRLLVKHAHRLYAMRGTREGLRLHVKLYSGVEPRIVEHFRLRRWLFVDRARLGDRAELYGRAVAARLQLDENSQIGEFALVDTGDPIRDPFLRDAHRFTVFVPKRPGEEVDLSVLERIIEHAKPAHTEASVRLVDPSFRLGTHAFVGVDTTLGRYPERLVEREGRVGFDTVLGPSEDEAARPTMRVGVRARIGSTTLLD